MRLYFLRHGEADWPDWQQSDDKRPLTDRGRKEMAKIANFLEKLDLELDQIVTSPLPRAKQTAEVVANRFKLKLSSDPMLRPGFGAADLGQLLRKFPGENVMIVGHEPDFTMVISNLTGASLKLSKAGIALVELEENKKRGRLLWLFPPKIAKAARR